MEKLRICLSDLPREMMRKGSNGKIYITLIVDERKEPDQWGQNLKVYVDQTKEQRTAHAPKTYVGGGKTYTFTPESTAPVTPEDARQVIPPPEEKKNDLPF